MEFNPSSPVKYASSKNAYDDELLKNLFWQILNFGSKGGFLIILTPMMILKWGKEGFGLFALASSLLVSMALLDGGVRTLTRIQIASALKRGDEEGWHRVYAEGLLTFSSVCLIVTLISFAVARSGWMTRVLNLPPGGSEVLVLTIVCTSVFMTTTLGLEPIAASGNLSSVKEANTYGALAAIPICAALVLCGASISMVIIAYSLSLTVPNLVVAWQKELFALKPWKFIRHFGPRIAWNTLRSGSWFYLVTIAMVLKSHALTFVISAMAGPVEAGMFYVLLRLSEMVSNVAATSCETTTAALTLAVDTRERQQRFRQSWLHVALFSAIGVLMFILLLDDLLSFWLKGQYSASPLLGLSLGCFGLSGALCGVVTCAAAGLNLARSGAIAGFSEELLGAVGATAGFYFAGLPGLFFGGSLGVFCLLPLSNTIAEKCGWSSAAEWIFMLRPLMPGIFLAGIIMEASSWSRSLMVWLLSLVLCAGIAFWQLREMQSSEKTDTGCL